MKEACKNCAYNPQAKNDERLQHYKCCGSPGQPCDRHSKPSFVSFDTTK